MALYSRSRIAVVLLWIVVTSPSAADSGVVTVRVMCRNTYSLYLCRVIISLINLNSVMGASFSVLFGYVVKVSNLNKMHFYFCCFFFLLLENISRTMLSDQAVSAGLSIIFIIINLK